MGWYCGIKRRPDVLNVRPNTLIPPFVDRLRWGGERLNSLLCTPFDSGPPPLKFTRVSTVPRMGKNALREVSPRASSAAFATEAKLDQAVQSSSVIPFAAKDDRAYELSRKKTKRTTEVAKLMAAKRDKRRRCCCCDDKRDKGQTKDGNRKGGLSPCEGDINDLEWPSESFDSTAGEDIVRNARLSLSQVQEVSLLDLLSTGTSYHKPRKKIGALYPFFVYPPNRLTCRSE
jgi:hypothetical protein